MAQIQVPAVAGVGARTNSDKINYRVRTRAKWTDDWETVDYLEPMDAELTTAPSVQRATMVFKYGEVAREDRHSFVLENTLKLRDHFVLIERFAVRPILDEAGFGPVLEEKTVPLFYGQITGENFNEHNLRTDSTGETGASGDQTLIAFGLEQMLDRVVLNQGVIENQAETGVEFTDFLMPFNRRLKRGQPAFFGNRSNSRYARTIGPATVESYVFNGRPSASGVWTNLDIAEFLLTWFSPGDILRGDVDFRLSGQTDAIAGLVIPNVDLEGATIRQALNVLIDRRRGVGWTIRVDKSNGINVHIFTVLDEPVSAGPVIIPANAQKIGLDLNGKIDIPRVSVTKDTATAYDSVIIFGERIRTVFSLEYPQDLVKGWTAQDEIDYKAATDEERSTDKFDHVYSLFKIRSDWDWTDQGGNICNPQFFAGILETEFQAPIRNWDRRILRNLPFLKQRDQLAIDAEPELEKPYAFVINPRKSGEPIQADRIEETIRDFPSASVRASDTEFAIEVKFNPNHVFALNNWTDAAKTKEKPKLDFDGMVITVAVELDERLKLVVINTNGINADPTQQRPGRVKTIYVADAHLWYAVTGTKRFIEDDAGVMQFIPEAGRELRNDIGRLEVIAALARAWYGRRRTATQIQINDITTAYPPGAFLNAASNVFEFGDQVGAVITSVVFDFANNSTTIQTGFLELDAQGFI